MRGDKKIMSSFKMHVAISEKVRSELNYSNLFILGSVLPDISN